MSPEQIALIAFTAMAAFSGETNIVKNLAKSWKTGFPGGCPTSSLYDEAMNSPQSQKLAVGSIVSKYTNEEAARTTAAIILLTRVNLLLSMY